MKLARHFLNVPGFISFEIPNGRKERYKYLLIGIGTVNSKKSMLGLNRFIVFTFDHAKILKKFTKN